MLYIAIDHDGTYDTDPETFDNVIKCFKEAGHYVFIVTARHPEKHKLDLPYEIFYTNGEKKHKFMKEQGIDIDIWIDDWPELIGNTREH
jgi:hypothetical protein